jgi:hypothetical protein
VVTVIVAHAPLTCAEGDKTSIPRLFFFSDEATLNARARVCVCVCGGGDNLQVKLLCLGK